MESVESVLQGPFLYLLIAWGIVTAVFLVLIAWRSVLTSHEDVVGDPVKFLLDFGHIQIPIGSLAGARQRSVALVQPCRQGLAHEARAVA